MNKKFTSVPIPRSREPIRPLCYYCKHLDWQSVSEDATRPRKSSDYEHVQTASLEFPNDTDWQCTAFPHGIPSSIIQSKFDHREKHPEDHGIQFEAELYEKSVRYIVPNLEPDNKRAELLYGDLFERLLYELEAGRRYGSVEPMIEIDPEMDDFPISPEKKKELTKSRRIQIQIETLQREGNREISDDERIKLWRLENIRQAMEGVNQEEDVKRAILDQLYANFLQPEIVVEFCREHDIERLLLEVAKSNRIEKEMRDLYQKLGIQYPA